jgi:hypothetical protein
MKSNHFRDLVTLFVALAVVIGAAVFFFTRAAHADQPVCTGDRHYDGVACCPVVDPPGDPTTTTTTLPPPCPPVVCQCDDPNNADVTCPPTRVVNVTVNRCPEVKFPRFAVCRQRINGKARSGDVIFNGKPYKCPRPLTPHRYMIPLSN